MKVLIAPDKFKGSLTAHEVCEAVSRAILSIDANADVVSLPLADGGEGTLDVLSKVLELEPVISSGKGSSF